MKRDELMGEGIFGGLIEQATKAAQASLPQCELCGGHLLAGAVTYNLQDRGPTVICTKCITKAVNYWWEQREKLKLNGE